MTTPYGITRPELDASADPAHGDALPLSGRELALIGAFWLLFAVVTVANRLLDPRRPLPVSEIWSADAILALAQAAVWGLSTVVLFRLAARVGTDRVSRARRIVPLVVAGVSCALVASVTLDLVRDAVFPLPGPGGRGRGPGPRGGGLLSRIGGFQLLNDLVIASGVVAAGLARAFSLRFQARQAQAVRLQAQLAEARLDALRRQLDPHFLFNTLHAVSTLVERDPRGVRRMITRLSELLRHSIEGAGEAEVPLRQELELLGRYLDIMQVRFQGRLEVDTRVDDAVLDALVPNLILQPLVENAIRHGVERMTGVGRITILAERRDGDVVLRVRDNGPGPAATAAAPPTGTARQGGVGLGNTVARLAQLYGAAGGFTLHPAEAGGAEAEVRLPFHTRADLRVAALAPGTTR